MKSRTRNLIAVSTLWAGLAGVAVAAPVAADSRPSVVDDASGTKAAKVVKAAKGQSLVTADPVAVTGLADNGSALAGTFQIERFRQKHGELFAVGRLTGTLGGQSVGEKVMIPVAGGTASEVAGPEPLTRPMQVPVPTPGACPILTLDLGPLDLDLLGLRVALAPVNLLIEAIPGDGNLLGNLLCGIAGLLDGVGGGGLGGLVQNLLDSIADLLNGLLGGL
jgi:hypothetical protein